MESMDNNKEFYRVINRAWAYDGKLMHTGEALLLGMLMHVRGNDRKSKDMRDIQRLMKDPNVGSTKNID